MNTNTNWKIAKEEFENMEIPEKLESIIAKEIENDRKKHKKSGQTSKYSKWIAAAACAAIFVGSVNASTTVAMAMYKVPVLGDLARVVTFRDYKFQDDFINIAVQVPEIENTGNEALEEKINKEIDAKMQQVVDEQKLDAASREAIAKEQGLTSEDIYQKGLFADYETKYVKGDVVSFVINTVETAGSSDTKVYYYNIDLQSGKDLTLTELLGADYKAIADEAIKKQMTERMEADENQIFFGFSPEDAELGVTGFTGVADNQSFYINNQGNVVITFDKYEIAPGYMGIPEFEIKSEE